MCASGVRVSLITDSPSVIARLEATPVECHEVRHLSGWRGWSLDGLLSSRFASPPDVVQIWGTAGLWWVRRWTEGMAIPLLIYCLGASHIRRVLRGGLRSHERVAAATNVLAGQFLDRFPDLIERCEVIGMAVAPPLLAMQGPAPERTLGVVCVGDLDSGQGLEVLIDAVAQLPSIRHRIAGGARRSRRRHGRRLEAYQRPAASPAAYHLSTIRSCGRRSCRA